MKHLIILILMVAGSTATFSQKAKQETSAKGKSAKPMNSYSCPMHAEVNSSKPGKCPKCGMGLTLSKKEEMKTKITHSYSCPMHSDVVSKEPGKCPHCSSKLVVDRTGSKQGRTVYTCSMHPDVSSTTGGKCAKCGMEMIAKKTKKNN